MSQQTKKPGSPGFFVVLNTNMKIAEIVDNKIAANLNTVAFPHMNRRYEEPVNFDYSEQPFMHVPWEDDTLDSRWPMAVFDKGTLIHPKDAPDPRFRGQGIANDNPRLGIVTRK